MLMKKTFPIVFLALIVLSACIQQIQPVPTSAPLEDITVIIAQTGEAAQATRIALTPTATETPAPTETPTPVPTSSEPTLTPTPEPGFNKFADMRFVQPGPMSSLVSPFDLKMLLTSGNSNRVRVDLLGEDGRALYREILRVDSQYGGNFRELEVTFEIRAVSENGYLRLSTKDGYGNLQALNTMPVLLHSIGNTQMTLPNNMIYERVTYEDLKNKSKIFGGEIKIKGRYWPFNTQPVFLDLYLTDGKVIASRILSFDGIEPQNFETTLPYKVTEPTIARLAIHQNNPILPEADADLKKYIYYYSIELLLNP